MRIANRIERFIIANGLNLSEFDKSIGVANGYIGKQIRKDGSVGSHIIEKIISAYPAINVRWLMTGKGEMFEEPVADRVLNKPVDKDEVIRSDVQDLTIVEMGKDTVSLLVKALELYDTSLRMGSEIYLLDETEPKVRKGFTRQNDFTCIRYKGTGMLPNISHGTYMISKKVERQDWNTAADNHLFIVSSSTGIYLGRLINKLKEGYVLILKNSSDKEKHPDVRVNVSDIESLWSVKGYMFLDEKGVHQLEGVATPISTIEKKLKNLLQEVEKIKKSIR